jgi:hypothetical protein
LWKNEWRRSKPRGIQHPVKAEKRRRKVFLICPRDIKITKAIAEVKGAILRGEVR